MYSEHVFVNAVAVTGVPAFFCGVFFLSVVGIVVDVVVYALM